MKLELSTFGVFWWFLSFFSFQLWTSKIVNIPVYLFFKKESRISKIPKTTEFGLITNIHNSSLNSHPSHERVQMILWVYSENLNCIGKRCTLPQALLVMSLKHWLDRALCDLTIASLRPATTRVCTRIWFNCECNLSNCKIIQLNYHVLNSLEAKACQKMKRRIIRTLSSDRLSESDIVLNLCKIDSERLPLQQARI